MALLRRCLMEVRALRRGTDMEMPCFPEAELRLLRSEAEVSRQFGARLAAPDAPSALVTFETAYEARPALVAASGAPTPARRAILSRRGHD